MRRSDPHPWEGGTPEGLRSPRMTDGQSVPQISRDSAGAGRPGSRARMLAPALVFALLAFRATAGEDPVSPEAAGVLAALERGDRAEITRIARSPLTDPFTVADDLLGLGRVDGARALAEAIGDPDGAALLEAVTRSPPDDPAVRARIREARTAVERGDLEQALSVLRGLKVSADSLPGLRVRMLTGRLLLATGDSPAARRSYAEAGEGARALGRDLGREIQVLGSCFDELAIRGDYRLALPVGSRILDAAYAGEDVLAVALWELNLGNVCVALQLADPAIRHLERARQLWRAMDAGDTPEERDYRRVALAGSETMLAEALAMAGRFVEALAAGESAVAVAGGTHDPVAQADALGALGNVYSAFGAKDRALAIYQRAAAAVQGDDPESRRARRVHRINEGTALQETGQTGQARRLLEEVLSAVDEEGDSSERIVLRLSLGEACEREGEWAQALRLHAQALALAAGDAGLAAWAKLRLGDALAKRGAESDPGILAKADALLAEALPDIEGAGDPALRMLVRASRGEVALGRGRAAEAVKYASEALRELDAMTGGLADGDIVEARSEADRRRVLTLGIRVAARSGDTGALFEACEQARGRAFVTALGGRRALRRQLLQPAAARRLEQAEAEVTLAYARQREALAAGDVPEAREATRELDATRERCEETLRGVEREARRLLAGPAIGMEKLPETLSRLGSGEALVVYALLPETSKALVLAAGTARCVDLAGQEAIATACAAFPGEDRKVSAETVGEAAGALRSLLVEPLGLPGALRTLTVVPDGVLAHLPWCLLLDRPGDAGPEVVLVPSAGVRTALLSRPRRRGTGRLAIGDPVYTQNEDGRALSVWAGGGQLNALPETAREVEESTGPGDVRLLRESATEAGFARALASRPHWRAVTLSCHGLVNDRNPALSALALTPAPPDDGFLTALEVYALDIPADLVVLSACETARDRAAGGEGVQGLVRAFLLAGAPRVLASLWRIDDAAAREFVVAFHWAFDRPGATTAGALRSAREEVRSRRPHPADWAGWVLWGRPD